MNEANEQQPRNYRLQELQELIEMHRQAFPLSTAYNDYLKAQGVKKSRDIGGDYPPLEETLSLCLFMRDSVGHDKAVEWPEEVLPRPGLPIEWRPSVRNATHDAWDRIRVNPQRSLAVIRDEDGQRQVEAAVRYSDWLRQRYVLEEGPARQIEQFLFGHSLVSRDLRSIALESNLVWAEDDLFYGTQIVEAIRPTDEVLEFQKFEAFAPQFELFYLGLPSAGEVDRYISALGPAVEEKLYAEQHFEDDAKYFQVANGGRVQLAALAEAYGMDPDDFRKHLHARAANPEADTSESRFQPVLMRSDRYLFRVLPVEDDHDSVVLGRVYVLSEKGVEIVESILESYEAGMHHTAMEVGNT